MRLSFRKTLATVLSILMVLSTFVGVLSVSAEAVAVGTLTIDDAEVTVKDGVFVVVADIALNDTAEYVEVAYKLDELTNGVTLSSVAADNGATAAIYNDNVIYVSAATAQNIAVTMTFTAPTETVETMTISVSKIEYADIGEEDETIDITNASATITFTHECVEGDPVTENVVDATCTTAGSYDTVIKCSVCGEELSRETTTVDALGHKYDDGVVTTAPDCLNAGVKTFTCATCGDTYTEAIDATGHTEEAIPPVAATCTQDGATAGVKCSVCDAVITAPEVDPATGVHNYEYTNNGDNHTKTCTVGNETVDEAHEFVDGKCACGAEEVVEPERLTFNGISRAKTLSLEDVVYVKATVAFVDVNGGKNYNPTGLDKDYVLENGKILFWSQNPGENPTIDSNVKYLTVSPLTYSELYKDTAKDAEAIHEYIGVSMGVPAKQYADTIYYRTYIVVDGEEYYGDVIEYKVQTYCHAQIEKVVTGSAAKIQKQAALRALCATMLNYGSSAQIQFNYNTENLSNAKLAEYVESGKLEAKYLELDLDESALVGAQTPAENMITNFAVNNAKVTAKTLAIEGAIEPKITVGYKLNGNFATQLPADAELEFYFWTSAQYEALAKTGTPLSKENAGIVRTYGAKYENGDDEVVSSYDKTYGYEYTAKPMGIPAKQLHQTFYVVAVVTEADGTEYCTGVNSYSPIQYVIGQLNKDPNAQSTEAKKQALLKLQDLCRWIATYNEAAEYYFSL